VKNDNQELRDCIAISIKEKINVAELYGTNSQQ
jgi:hypothetical protein